MEKVDINLGLSENQVNYRINNNLVNKVKTKKTKSIKRIIIENTFTLFNLLNIGLAVIVLLVGSYKNVLFLGIVLCNTLISTIQEIRSKLIIDKLSKITSFKTKVIRNGKVSVIDNDDIVIDDIILLKSGNQIAVDCIIKEGRVSVNESFITGESDLISYKENDILKSGSFITSGNCKASVIHVGKDNYMQLISSDIKLKKQMNSVLMNSLNKIIKIISIIIIPVGLILFFNQYGINHDLNNSIIRTVAALIGMIPEGLILLTSSVLAVSILRLSKQNVLVQELYCIEMLARVDTICLDKTGTITDGKMEVIKVINLDKNYDVDNIMGNIVNSLEADNATFDALQKYFKKCDNYKVIEKIPFSSEYKYSGVKFSDATYIIGAPEFIYNKTIKEVVENQDNRVLLLCEKKETNIPIAVIVIKDTIRKNAKEMFDYLKSQDVNIKIISGDNLKTIENVLKQAGMSNLKCVDVSNLNDEQFKDAVFRYDIFSRVTPVQKKKIVEILQSDNHFVAMTGDGVNDCLALRQADCSITIKSATDAARNVSQIVLLDDDFSAIASIVNEGRRTINNISRSASLFLTKTTYALLLALVFIFIDLNYPFEPIQLTLTSCFTIGIPSFILALEPNRERIKGNFLINVFCNSLPAALTIVINIIILSILGFIFKMSSGQVSTLCVIMTGFTGFLLLFRICLPLNRLRLSLIILLILGFIGSVIGFRKFYSLTIFNFRMFLFICILVLISTIIFNLMSNLVDKLIKKYPKLFS